MLIYIVNFFECKNNEITLPNIRKNIIRNLNNLLDSLSMKKAILIFFFSLAAVCSTANAKSDKDETIYLFGASFSFSDSVVYFTEIMPVDGAKLDKKTKFLLHRQYYAYELKDYMTFQENMPGRTSVIYFSKKRSKLAKTEAKIKKKLVEKQGKTVRYLGEKFKFVKP